MNTSPDTFDSSIQECRNWLRKLVGRLDAHGRHHAVSVLHTFWPQRATRR